MEQNVHGFTGTDGFVPFCEFDYPYHLDQFYQNPMELDFGQHVEFWCQVNKQKLSIHLKNCSSYVQQLLACFEGALEIQSGIDKLMGDLPQRMVQTFGNMHISVARKGNDWSFVVKFFSNQSINDKDMIEKSNLLSILCLIHLYKLANIDMDKTTRIVPQLRQAIDNYTLKLEQAHQRVLVGLLTEVHNQVQNFSPFQIPALSQPVSYTQPLLALQVGKNPFEQLDSPRAHASSNPFDEDISASAPANTNPFEVTEQAESSNPFEDSHAKPVENSKMPPFLQQHQNSMSPTNPFTSANTQQPQYGHEPPQLGPFHQGGNPFAPEIRPIQVPPMQFSFAPANNFQTNTPHEYTSTSNPFETHEPAKPNFDDSDDQIVPSKQIQTAPEQRIQVVPAQQAQLHNIVNQLREPEPKSTFNTDSPWGELWSNPQLQIVWDEFKRAVPKLNEQDQEHFRTALLSAFLKKIAHLPVDLFKLQQLLADYDGYAYVAQCEQPEAEVPSLGNSDQIMEIFCKLVTEQIDFHRGKDYKLLDVDWVLNYLHENDETDTPLTRLLCEVLLDRFPDLLKKLNLSRSEPVLKKTFQELGNACQSNSKGLSGIDLYKLVVIFRYVEAIPTDQFNMLVKQQPFWGEPKVRLQLWTNLVETLIADKPTFFFESHKNFQSLLDFFSQLPLQSRHQIATVNKFFSDFLDQCKNQLKFDYFAMLAGSKFMTDQDGTQSADLKKFEAFLNGMDMKQELFDQIFNSSYNNRLPLAYWRKLLDYMYGMYFDADNEGTLSNELFKHGRNSRFHRAWQVINGLKTNFKDNIVTLWQDQLCRQAANTLVDLQIKYEDFDEYLKRNRPREITAAIIEVLGYYVDIKGDRQVWFENQFQIWEQMSTRRQYYQALSQKLTSLGKQLRFPPEYEQKSAFLQWSQLVANFQAKYIYICRLVELPPIPIIKDELMKNCRPDLGIDENERLIKEATIVLSTKFSKLMHYVEQKQFQEYQNLLKLGTELLEKTLKVLMNDSADMSENSNTICMMLSVFSSMQLGVEIEKDQFESLTNFLHSKFGLERPSTNPWDEVLRLKAEDKLKLAKSQLDKLDENTKRYLQNRVLRAEHLQIISACAEIFYHVEDDSPDFWENLERNYVNNDFSSNNIPNELDRILKLGMDAFRTEQAQNPDLLTFLESILKQDSLLKYLSVLVDQKDAILELINKPFERDAYDVMKLFDGNTQILLCYNEEFRVFDAMLANRPSRTTSTFFNDKGQLAVKLGDTQNPKIKTFESLDALCTRLRKSLESDSYGTNAPKFKVTVSLCELIHKILEGLNKIDSYGYLLTAALLKLRLVPGVKVKKTFIVEVPMPTQPDSFEESLSELLNLQQKLENLLVQIEEEMIQISKTDARWVLSLRAAQRELLTEYLIAPLEEKPSFEKLEGELVSILQFAAGNFNDARHCLTQFKKMLNSRNLLESQLTEDQGPFKLLSKLQAFSQTSGRRPPEQTTEFKIRYGEYENNNKYLSLLCYTARRCKAVPTFEPCQFLFANQLTTTAQLTSFLTFAMSEKYMFYIMDLDLLQPKVRGEMIHKVTELQSSLPKNGNIMMFFKKPDELRVKQELQRYSDIFASVEPSEMKYTDKLRTQENWISKFMQGLGCEIICSRFAGLGKSHHIRRKCKQESRELFSLQLSGEISDFTLAKRFSMVHEGLSNTLGNQTNKPALSIRIDMMEKLTDNMWMIDQLLFQMVILRCVAFKKGFLNLSNLGFVYLEIGNNYRPMLMELPFIRWVIFEDKNLHDIDRIRVNTWDFDAQVKAKAVVVANIFQMINQMVFQRKSLFDPGQWADHIQAIETLTDELDTRLEAQLNPYQLSKETVHGHLLNAFLKKLAGFDEPEQPSETNANMAQIVAFIHVLFHQFSQMDGNFNLTLRGLGSALAEEREAKQYTVLLEVRKNLSELIPVLSSKFIWSKTNTLRQEAKATKQFSSVLAKMNNKISGILKQFRQTLQQVKPWTESDNFAVIFSDGAMKLFYKQVEDVPESLRQIVSFFNQRLVQHKDLSQEDQQIHFLRQLMESFDRLFTSDFCQNFLQMPERDINATEDKPKLLHYLKHIRRFQNGRGFSFNSDNMLKMLLIRQKIQALQPVVIIGSTGCGKTYLISFLVKQILLDVLRITTLHSGVTEDDLVKFVCEAIKEAKRQQAQQSRKKVWVFFDEFNTSPLQSLIQELAVNRTCTFSSEIREEIKIDKYTLPKNMVFVLICNPLRVKKNDTNIGLIHENAATAFTHRVFPIPDTLLNYAWDFGQLTPEVERKYIEPLLIEDRNHPEYLIDCVCEAQDFLRKNEGENSVSLRDIQRVRVIYAFLQKFLHPLQLPNLARDALICTIYLNYFLRIGTDDFRTQLDQKLMQLRSREKTFAGDWTFKTEFTKIAKRILDEINLTESANLSRRQIIANTAVRETVFALAVSVLTNTPIMICGKPGSSKTLSTTIVKSYLGLDPKDRTGAVLFRSQPRVVFRLFNGSQITKSTDVKAFYKDCQSKAAALNSGLPPNSIPIRVVFLFDEMGLAEIGYDNPLKVLHPLLEEEPGQDPEPGTTQIGFVGVSNWKLDLSKMSRALFVARPDPTEEDLKEMVEDDGFAKKLTIGDLCQVPKALAQAYLDFIKNESREKEIRAEMKKAGDRMNTDDDGDSENEEENEQYSQYYHPNFFGLRDFYHLIKYLKRNFGVASEFLSSKEQLLSFIENGIQRNFSGKMSMIHRGFEYELREGAFPSSKVFLHIFHRRLQILGYRTGGSHSTDSYGKSTVINLINQNLIDHGSTVNDTRSQHRIHGSRHLMLFYENPTIFKHLKDRLKGFFMDNNYNANQIIEYSRVNSEGELRKIVQELPRILNSKNVLILQDTEQLYSCLYEVLNQYYNQNGDRKCYIHTENGAKSEEVTIHEDLRIIIMMNRVDDALSSFETKHPPPFLNRCEKHLVLYSDVINDDQVSLKVKLTEEFEKYRRSKVGQKQILIHGYSDEVIYSLVLGADNFKALNFRSNFTMLDYLKQLLQQISASDSKMQRSIATNHSTTDRPEILSKAKQTLAALYSREMYFFLLENCDRDIKSADTLKRIFLQQHKIGSLSSYINDLHTKVRESKERVKHGLVYTLSSPWEATSIIKQSRKRFIKYITYSLYQTYPHDRRIQTLEELLSVQDQELCLLIISFENRAEWSGIPELRENVEKLFMGTSKRVLFLAHYSNQDLTNPNKKMETSITFMSDRWNIMAIDNLHESDYELFAECVPRKIGSLMETLAEHKTLSDSQILRPLRKRIFLKIQQEFKFPIEKPVQQLLFGHEQDPNQAEAEFFNLLLRKAIKERKVDNRDEEYLFDAIKNQRDIMIANGNEHTLEYCMESFQVVLSGRLQEALEASVVSLRNGMIHLTNKLARSFTIGGQSQTKLTQNWIAEAKKLILNHIMDLEEDEEAAAQNQQPQVRLEKIDALKSLESQNYIKRLRRLKEDNNQQLKDRFKNTLNAITSLFNKAKPMVKVIYPDAETAATAKEDYELSKLQALDLCNLYLQGRKLKVLGASQERLLARMLDAFVDVINPANTTSKLLELNKLENLCPLAIVLCEVFEPDLATLPDKMEEELAKQLVDQFKQGLYINASFTIIEKLREPLPEFSSKTQLESAKKFIDDQKVISAKLLKEERYKPELAVVAINEAVLEYLGTQTDEVLHQFSRQVFGSGQIEGSQYEANLRLAQRGFDFLVDQAKTRRNDPKLRELCERLLGLIQEFAGLEFKSKQIRSAVLLTVQKCIDVLGKRDDRQAVQAFTDVRAQLEEQPKCWAEIFSADPIVPPEAPEQEQPEPEEEGMIEVGAAPKVVRSEPLSNTAKGTILKSYERLVEKLAESEGRPTAKNNFEGAVEELNRLVTAKRSTQTENKSALWRAASAYYFVGEFLKPNSEDANSTTDTARQEDIKEIDKVLEGALPEKPAAAILFKQLIQQSQGDDKLLRKKGFTRLADCLDRFYTNHGFRSFTDLAQQEKIQQLKQTLQDHQKGRDDQFWSNPDSVDIAVCLAQFEILESIKKSAVVDLSVIEEGTQSYLYRVLWAFFHRRDQVSQEEREVYLLISYLAILVGQSDKTKLKGNVAKIERAIADVLHEQETKKQEITQNHLKLLVRILNLVKMCSENQTWLLDTPKEIEANAQEIKTEVEQLRFKSRLQNFHLRANISKFFTKCIAVDRPQQVDSLQLVNEIDMELQKILAGGYNQSADQQQTQAQMAVKVPEEQILDPVTANVLVALEVAPEKNLNQAESVEVYGRGWVPTLHNLEVFIADAKNQGTHSRVQAGFICRLNAWSPIFAQYPGMLQAAQTLCKAFKRYENGCFSGDESLHLRVSEFVGSEIPQSEDFGVGILKPINAEGTRYQSEISKAWVDFRARWFEFKELERSFSDLFDYKRLESSGAKPSLFTNNDDRQAFLNALLSPNSPVTMFLIPDAEYAKKFEPSGIKRARGSYNVQVTVQQRYMFLMRAIVNELISLHNWFVRTLIDAKFAPDLGPRPEEVQNSLKYVDFMSFKPEVIPMLKERQFQTLLEECATKDKDGNIIIKVNRQLDNLYSKNFRLIKPLGFEESSIFSFSDMERQNLMDDFKKKLVGKSTSSTEKLENEELDMKAQLQNFRYTSEIMRKNEWNLAEIKRINLILGSLHDDFELDGSHTHETPLQDIFGQISETIYGFPALQRKHLIHYLMILGMKFYDLAILSEATDRQEKGISNLPKLRKVKLSSVSESYNECQQSPSKITLTKDQVEMEICWWRYHLGIYSKQTLDSMPTVNSTVLLAHMSLYSYSAKLSPDKKPVVMEFVKWHMENKENVRNPTFDSEKPMSAIPKVMTILEELLIHLQKEASRQEEDETRRREGEAAKRKQEAERQFMNMTDETLNGTARQASNNDAIEGEMDIG